MIAWEGCGLKGAKESGKLFLTKLPTLKDNYKDIFILERFMKKFIYLLFLFLSISIYAENTPLKRVAIIGGGMSGVSTGAFLKDKKLEVHLFEKENRLGGHVRTFPLPGAPGKLVNVDVGPQYINQKVGSFMLIF